VPLGLALLAAALVIEATPSARWATAMAALALVALSLPRGSARKRYAGWTPRLLQGTRGYAGPRAERVSGRLRAAGRWLRSAGMCLARRKGLDIAGTAGGRRHGFPGGAANA
jgi:hypothetical protein